MWTPWASTFTSTSYLSSSWQFFALVWSCVYLSLAYSPWEIIIPCKVAGLSHVWKYLGTGWTSSQYPWYCLAISCLYWFLVSLVYQSCFPSGTPGRFATGHVPVWAPSWLAFGFCSFISRYNHLIFGRGSNIRYYYLKELIFSFSMVYILSQLDIYWESYGTFLKL